MTVTETMHTRIAMEIEGRRVEIKASKGLATQRLVEVVKLLTAELEKGGDVEMLEPERQPRQRATKPNTLTPLPEVAA